MFGHGPWVVDVPPDGAVDDPLGGVVVEPVDGVVVEPVDGVVAVEPLLVEDGVDAVDADVVDDAGVGVVAADETAAPTPTPRPSVPPATAAATTNFLSDAVMRSP